MHAARQIKDRAQPVPNLHYRPNHTHLTPKTVGTYMTAVPRNDQRDSLPHEMQADGCMADSNGSDSHKTKKAEQGIMTVTLKDVAQVAGMSTSAVSRSFTPGAPVSDITRTRIQDIARRMGYRPNRLATGLATGRTGLVGIVVDDMANPFYLSILDQFTHGLQELGLRPMLINLRGETEPDASLKMVEEYAAEAVILLSSSLSIQFIRSIGSIGIPVVHAFGRSNERLGVSQAGIKDSASGRLAAKTFKERGYSKLAFIGGDLETAPWRDRFAGFRNMGVKLDLSVTSIEAAQNSYTAGYTSAQTLLADHDCDAIFCGSDALAIGALAALRGAGKSVPDDIGLIGIDDMEMAGWHGIELTTIRQPVDQIIAAAIAMTQRHLDCEGADPVVEIFDTQLVERATLRRA